MLLQTVPPKDHLQVLATVKYPSALNNIFEKTLLGRKTRIFCAKGRSIQRLDEGFAYFREWADGLVKCGSFNGGVDSNDFIALQVVIFTSSCISVCVCTRMRACMCVCTCVHAYVCV